MGPSSTARSDAEEPRPLALLDLANVLSLSGHGADAFIESEPLLAAYFSASRVGLAVLDTNLCYVTINKALADMNGIPAEAHLGKSIRELMSDLAEVVEPPLQRVLDTHQP